MPTVGSFHHRTTTVTPLDNTVRLGAKDSMTVGTDLPLPHSGIYLIWKVWAHVVCEGPLSFKNGHLARFAIDFI